MFHFDDANKYGKEAVDTVLKSCSSMAKGVQALTIEAQDYSRKSYEDGAATFEKLAGAKSFEKAFEIQSDYARASYEAFFARAAKMSEICTEIARDAFKPYDETAGKKAA